MAGGLLSLVSQGQQSIILFGNPSKTFLKALMLELLTLDYKNFA